MPNNKPLLRKVLYRIDFQFITEQKQEQIYTDVVDKMGDKFDRYDCERAKQVDLEIDSETLSNPIFRTREQNVYFLSKQKNNCEDGLMLKIGRTFIFLEIKLSINGPGNPYYEWFAEVVTIAKNILGKMFSPVRVGLRKFNSFFVLEKDKEHIEDIFGIPFFNKIEDSNMLLDNFEEKQFYICTNEYKLIYSKKMSAGRLSGDDYNEEPAFLIDFDFDLYSTDNELLEGFCDGVKPGLEKMNGIVYGVFEKVMSSVLISKINNDESLTEFKIISTEQE